MKIYETQQEVEADIKDGVLDIKGDVKFECSISIEASIVVTFGNLTAWDINARDITYYAFCFVYDNIKCKSIKAKRTPAQPPICLDGKLEISNTPMEQ